MGKFIISSETEINRENVADWLSQFENDIKPQLEELNSYYKGIDDLQKAKISKKKRIDNKIHVNLASMIVNNSVNYFIGKPISYKFNDGFNSKTIEELQADDIEEIENKSLAKDCSKFGIAYELVGIKETKELYYKRLDPLKTFLVVMILCLKIKSVLSLTQRLKQRQRKLTSGDIFIQLILFKNLQRKAGLFLWAKQSPMYLGFFLSSFIKTMMR